MITDNDINLARKLHTQENLTCILKKGDIIFKSTQKGIQPLMDWLEDENDYSGFVAVDKTIGRAAAFLFVKLNIKKVFTHVISIGAKEIFELFNVDYNAEKTVPFIINRSGTGVCPMENAVTGIFDPNEAYFILKNKLEEMKKQS